MMQCVSFVSYHVVVNHDGVGPISLQCELRHRDPLSPYLYILFFEGLVAMIWKTKDSGKLHGARICRGSTYISQLFFLLLTVSFFVKQLQMSQRNSRVLLTPMKLLVAKLSTTKNQPSHSTRRHISYSEHNHRQYDCKICH